MFDTELSPMHMTPLNDFSLTADERLTKTYDNHTVHQLDRHIRFLTTWPTLNPIVCAVLSWYTVYGVFTRLIQ